MMKKYTLKRMLTPGSLVLAIALLFFYSCKKDKENTKEVLAYLPAGSAAFNVNSGSIAILRNTILKGINTSFPVFITRPFTTDIQVTAKIDTGLVKQYDKENSVTSLPLPADAFTLLNNGSVTIKAGEITSVDSLEVRLTDATKIKPGANTYIVPVVLTMASGNIPVSNARQIMYLKIAINNTSVSLAEVSGKNTVDILLKRTSSGTTGTNLINLQAILNVAISQPLNVKVVENASLVAAYNTANNTAYKPFPAGAFKFAKDNATIAPETTASTDNAQVQLPDLSLFTADTDYLLAVQILDNGEANVSPSNAARNTVYIHVNTYVHNIDDAQTLLAGTLAVRTGWATTVSNTTNGALGPAMIDGSNTTAWRSSNSSTAAKWLTMDMKSAQQIKGFRLVPNYVTVTENATTISVSTSMDGIIWKPQGEWNGTGPAAGSTAANPDLKHINFITPVQARYFRFDITKWVSGNRVGIAELNVVQ